LPVDVLVEHVLELLFHQRLGQEAVHCRLIALLLLLCRHGTSQRDHRHLEAHLPHVQSRLAAVHFRHLDIHENHLNPIRIFSQNFDGVYAVFRRQHMIAPPLKFVAAGAHKGRVVLTPRELFNMSHQNNKG